ncbi:MAG: hypothetical protein IT204_02140 [Fimbriimonadaceae bacterium]|nr:hypothetical protein [Fimbriimonadaceae bacterium]
MQPDPVLKPARLGPDPALLHAALVAEAALLLPLGGAGLVGVLGFLAPLVAQRTGCSTGLLGHCAGLAAVRVPVLVGSGLLVLLAWAGLRTAVVRRLFEAQPLVARLLGKLLLLLPLLASVALLLLVVTTPLLAALSVKP